MPILAPSLRPEDGEGALVGVGEDELCVLLTWLLVVSEAVLLEVEVAVPEVWRWRNVRQQNARCTNVQY